MSMPFVSTVEADRCANCGNRARFNVTVAHREVTGMWVRLACSRMCAHILSEHGRHEVTMFGHHDPRYCAVTVAPVSTSAA